MIKFYKSRLLSDYKLIEQLEKEFGEYVNARHSIAIDSNTNGIGLVLRYEREVLGKETIEVPTMTFVSVANEVIHSGHKLVLTDKCYVGKAYRLYGSHVVDSAHEVKRNQMNEYNALTKVVYSFYPTKLVPSYEGGMICTNDEKFAKWARVARQCGRTGYGSAYDVSVKGWKINMTPMQAKEALKSLRMLDKVKAKQKKMREFYNEYLTPVIDTDHIYAIVTEKPQLVTEIAQYSRHFKPIHQMSAYKEYNKKGKFRGTETLSKGIISLPLHPYLTRRDQMKIINDVTKGDVWDMLFNFIYYRKRVQK